MLRTLLLTCALLLFGASTHADSGKPLLWTVQGKTNTVYLFGSVHYLRPTDVLPEALDRAYRDAAALVMEIDLDDFDPATSASVTKLGTLPAGEGLQRVLGKELFQKLMDAVRVLGGDPNRFAKLRPWAAALSLEDLQMEKLGFEQSAGVEERLSRRAQADRKEITGLETFEVHFNVLAGMPAATEREFLAQTVAETSDAARLIEELIAAWRAGDLQPLERYHEQVLEDHPDIYIPLTVERNRRWIAQLETLLGDSKNYLVVVGALHLVGKDSVIELLRKKGYDVVRK